MCIVILLHFKTQLHSLKTVFYYLNIDDMGTPVQYANNANIEIFQQLPIACRNAHDTPQKHNSRACKLHI